MNANSATFATSPPNTKSLWAAVGILGVAVLALGASLVHVQNRPLDGHAAVLATTPADEPALAPPGKTRVLESAPGEDDLAAAPTKTPSAVRKPTRAKPVAVMAQAGQVAAPPVASPAPAAPMIASAGGAASVVTGTAQAPVPAIPVPTVAACANCGTIEAVTPIQRKGTAGAVGAVAGGVLGAVLGSRVGHGGTRTAATILGALGGGFAGNAIEKRINTQTVYQVQVRMQDGSMRSVEQDSSPPLGAKVVVDGGALRSTDGSWPPPAAPRPQAQDPQQSDNRG